MPRRLSRAAVVLASALAVASIVGPESTALIVGAVVALAVAASVGARYLAVAIIVHLIGVGDRTRAHSRGVDEVPAPRHPNTQGRRRSRAPSLSAAVA